MSSSWVFKAKTSLVIGATSGLGEAIARRLAKQGVKTVIAGRRKENLEKISSASDKLHWIEWDVSDFQAIPGKTAEVLKEHPEINQVWIVAGLQRTTSFFKPESLDLDEISLEINTNLIAPIHLMKAFIPHLVKQPDAVLAVVSSSLALLPAARTPVYNGTKAGLHQMLLSMRLQFENEKTPVNIVEIYPPAVKTELHDPRLQKDLPGIEEYGGMEIEDAIDQLWEQLEQGALDIPIGDAKAQYENIDVPRRKMMAEAAKK